MRKSVFTVYQAQCLARRIILQHIDCCYLFSVAINSGHVPPKLGASYWRGKSVYSSGRVEDLDETVGSAETSFTTEVEHSVVIDPRLQLGDSDGLRTETRGVVRV